MTITIIGAGISGLVLSRCLLHRGIPSLILEKTGQAAFTHKRNNYGITLHRKTYQPLLKFLGVDEERFTREVGIGGVGVGGELLRVNRRLFEGFLSEGLDVRWEGEGESLDGDGKAGGQGVLVKLRGGEEIQSEVVVGADGPHSLVREKISPETQFDILPFVAINGRRRLAPAELQEAGMANESIVEQRVGDALFRVSLDERMEREGEVGISWTFSRPARRGEDALFRPQRAKKAAKEIPEELFGEVEGMNGQLRGVLKVVFDTEKMRGDRMLNWLMRTVEVDSGRLNDAAKKGIVLMGDAVHAEPILGGEGANVAIQDGMRLAELLADGGTASLSQFYDDKQDIWAKSVKESKARIFAMHGVTKPSL